MARKDTRSPTAAVKGTRSTKGKSKSKAKRNKRQRRFEPAFSIAVWFPATEAIARLTRLLGSPKLARHQLCRDIRSKRLPAAIRCIRLRDRSETFERLTLSELESFDVESLLEVNAAEIGGPDGRFCTIDDGEYGGAEEQSAHAASAAPTTECWLFVDRGRFEKRYPDAAVSANDTMPPRAPPGPKPKGDWYVVLGAWLIDVACDNPKRLRNVDALVVEAKLFLKEKIRWAPTEDKELRQKIVEFLQFVPR